MTATIAPPRPFLTTDRKDVAPSPVSSDYTIVQAAQLLDMPEDCINELLDVGILKFRQDGECRLILRERLLEYDRNRKFREKGVLEIIRLDEEMGLYDD
jgi:hypothetical protein